MNRRFVICPFCHSTTVLQAWLVLTFADGLKTRVFVKLPACSVVSVDVHAAQLLSERVGRGGVRNKSTC